MMKKRERYTQVVGQLNTQQTGQFVSQPPRARHHSPPTRLVSSPRAGLEPDRQPPRLECCRSSLASMEAMTAEQKISTRRGEQEYVQKKTFTNWMNTYLVKASPPVKVNDLFEEIRDGVVLIRLLEVLSRETLPVNLTADMKPAHCLSNVKTALDFLASKKVKLVNINPVDVVEGRPKIVLGLIWVIILYFQIEEQKDMLLELLGIPKTGSHSTVTAKQALTTWVQNAFSEQFNIDIKDFGPSWRDGVAFNAIVHSIDPKLVDMQEVERGSNRENLHRAFTVAEEKLGIPKILDPEDVDVDRPDEKSIMTYVAQFYKAFPETGKAKSLSADEREQRQFREFLDALQQGESRITESIRLNESFKTAFPVFNTINEIVEKNAEFVDLLRAKVDNGTLVGGQYSPQSGLDAFGHFEGRLKEWRWWLFERSPGELRQAGRWIVSAERWMERVDAQWCHGEEDGVPLPAPADSLRHLIAEQKAILGPDSGRAEEEAGRLHKLLAAPDVDASAGSRMEESMAQVVDKVDGYVAALSACSCCRRFLDATQESNLAGTIEEWAELVSGNRQDETPAVAVGALEAFKALDAKMALSAATPGPVADLSADLHVVMRVERSGRPLPCGLTSEVVGCWLQRVVDAFQPAALEGASLGELGQRLDARTQAWRTYETKLNQVVTQLEETQNKLERGRPDIKKVDMEAIEEALQEAERAAGVLGTPSQLNSVAVSRRRWEELRTTIAEKTLEEAAVQEAAKERIKEIVTAISAWNERAEGLLTQADRAPGKVDEKMAAIRDLMGETDSLDDLLQSVEHTKLGLLGDAQVEQMDAVAMEFFQHQRTLAAQLQNLEQISAKGEEIEELFARLEGELEAPTKDFEELQVLVNRGISELTNLISGYENLVRSAPVKAYVRDLGITDFTERNARLADDWKIWTANHRLEAQATQDFEEALDKVDALLTELARYFDAIETDLASANADLVKRGMAMFEDLSETLNERLPRDMEELREAERVLRLRATAPSGTSRRRDDLAKRVGDAERRHEDLLRRRETIERECRRAVARLQHAQEFTGALQSGVGKARTQLSTLRNGPKITGRSTPKDLEAITAWCADCEGLASLLNSCGGESVKLQSLLEDPNFHPPPGSLEVLEEYGHLRQEVDKLVAMAGNLKIDFHAFKEGVKEVDSCLQAIKAPAEKGRWGSRQSLRASASVELLRRSEEIKSQLQVETRTDEVLREMQACVERIFATALPPDVSQALRRELEEMKKRAELAFSALRSEETQITRSLEFQSELESSLQALEDWLTTTEAIVTASLAVGPTIRENLQQQQAELSRLGSLFNELTSTGSQRISELFTGKEELADEGLKERRRRLKTRHEALVKVTAQARDRCSKSVGAWKEHAASVEGCAELLRGIENKLAGVEEESVGQEVDALKEAIQTASRRGLQRQRILEEIAGSLESVDKRIHQIQQYQQRSLPKDLTLAEVDDLLERRARAKRCHEELTAGLQRRRSVWTELQEVHKVVCQLVEQVDADLLAGWPDYPANPHPRQLKQILEVVESVRQGEAACARSVEETALAFSARVDARLTEMHRLCAEIGDSVVRLVEKEDERIEGVRSRLAAVVSLQTGISRRAEALATSFMHVQEVLTEINKSLDELASSRNSRSPDTILEAVKGLCDRLGEEKQHVLDEFTSAVEGLQKAYLPPRRLPQFLAKLPDSVRDCVNETAKRLDKITSEATLRVAELDDLYSRLLREFSSVETEASKVVELLALCEEVNAPDELPGLRARLKEVEAAYNAAVSRLKRLMSQASKVKNSEKLSGLLSSASKVLADGQGNVEKARATLKQTAGRMDKFTKGVSAARDAVHANISALQQSIHLRQPIQDIAELRERLASLEALEEDLMSVEGSSALDTAGGRRGGLLPTIASTVNDVLLEANCFADVFVDEALKPLHGALKTYSECLDKARESVESAIDAASGWMADSKVQMDEFHAVLGDLKHVDLLPPVEFDSFSTTRMEGLQKVRDMERSWLPPQLRQVEKLIREANANSVGGMGLSSIEEVRLRLEDLQKLSSCVKADLANAILVWETRVSEERELKQLSTMAGALCDRFVQDLDDIEPRYRFVALPEAEEMLSRLQFLKGQVSVGDELAAKIRSLASSNGTILSTFPCLARWDNLSKHRLDALVEGVEQMIAERTGKEKETLVLQAWLNDFHHTVQEATADAQSSNDISALEEKVKQLKAQLNQWEKVHLTPYSLKAGSTENASLLEAQRSTVAKQLDQLERAVEEKARGQSALESRLKQILAEVDDVCLEIEGKWYRNAERGEATSAAEVCANLRGSRESLRSLYEPKVESLFVRLYSLECDALACPSLSEGLQSTRQKLEGARKTLQLVDDSLSGQINAWQDVIAMCQQIEHWVQANETSHPKEGLDANEVIAVPIEAFSKAESHRNMERLDALAERRCREVWNTKKKMEALGAGRKLLNELRKRADAITEGKPILMSTLGSYEEKVDKMTDEMQTKLQTAEKGLNRVKTLQSAVSNLDTLVLECGETTLTADQLQRRCESAQMLLDSEIRPVVQEDIELRVQLARGERLLQILLGWERDRQARDRALASERESLRVLTSSLRNWLLQWSSSLEEACNTADLELGIQLTAGSPPSKLHCLDNLRALHQEVQTKKQEIEGAGGRSGSKILVEGVEENTEISALRREIGMSERRANRCILELTERCNRVDHLRESLQKAREWIKTTKKRMGRLKTLRSSRDLDDNGGVDLALEDVEAVASQLRQNLTRALSLLQVGTGAPEGSSGGGGAGGGGNSLLQVALTEVNKTDEEIEHMLETVSQAKASHANFCVISAGLDKLIHQSAEALTANSARVSDLLARCLGNARRLRSLSPAKPSSGRLAPQIERMAMELSNLDELGWLESVDVLVQELKFVEADVKMNAAQFQSMAEQCGALRRDYADDSRTTQVDHLLQQNNQLLRACEELIDHFNIVACQSRNWNEVCRDFVAWTDKQASTLARLNASCQNAAPTEQCLAELETLRTDLDAGVTKQQTVADETQKLSVAVSRALHFLDATSALLPPSGGRVQPRRGLAFSIASRWHNSILSAVGVLDELMKTLPGRVDEYERTLGAWKRAMGRQRSLENWLEMAEAKVGKSIRLVEWEESVEDDAVWNHQVHEMRTLESALAEKRLELKSLEDELLHLSAKTSGSVLTETTSRLNSLELRFKSHLSFLNDVQELADDFTKAASGLEAWMRRVERKALSVKAEEGAFKLEHCRSILHQLVIRANFGSPLNLEDTHKLMQELRGWKSAVSRHVCSKAQHFRALEEQFDRLTGGREETLPERLSTDSRHLCPPARQAQRFLDENLPTIHSLLPTHDLEDTVGKLAYAKATLSRLEDFSAQIRAATSSCGRRGDEARDPHHLLFTSDLEHAAIKSDASTAVPVRETLTRLNRAATTLKASMEELRRQQEEWRAYAAEVDALRGWLLHLARLGRGSLEEIRQAGKRLEDLRGSFRRVSGKEAAVDAQLEKLDAEYRSLLRRVEHRESPERGGRGDSESESARNPRIGVLTDLLQAVRHIKSDVKRADLEAERSPLGWTRSDRAWRTSTKATRCHVCWRLDPSKTE